MVDQVNEESNEKAVDIEISTLTDYFDEYVSSSRDARMWSEKSRDYYDGNQIPKNVAEMLNKRHQPQTVNNRIQPMVDSLTGAEILANTDPKAVPRTPLHEKDAFAATDAIRYVTDANKFDSIATEVYENFLIEGMGGVEVVVEGKGKKRKIIVRKKPYDRMFFDSHSRSKQMEGIQYSGTVTWDDLKNVAAKWPDSKGDLEGGMNSAPAMGDDETFADVPPWFESKRERVMYIEIYFMHKQEWHRAVVTKGVFLEKAKLSPYKDDDGVRINPDILARAKITRKGGSYGAVKTRLSMQDDINAANIKMTDSLTRNQTFSKGPVEDIRKFKEQANDSGGHMEFPQGKGVFGKDFGLIPNPGLPQAQFERYKEAIRQMGALANGGIAAGNETNLSGKALRRVDANRSLEIQPIDMVYRDWKIRVYEAIWQRIRQFWTEERWVKTTDDPKNIKWVGLNRRMTIEDAVIDQFGAIPPELENDPRLKEELSDENGNKLFMNRVADMDVDIFIEDVPDVLNLQAEQVDLLADLYKVNPEDRILNAIIKLMPLRDKEAILGGEPTPEQLAEQQKAKALQETAAMLKLAGDEADVKNTQADTAKTESEAKQTQIENFVLERLAPNLQPTSFSI